MMFGLNNLLLIIYILGFIATGIGLGYFFKGLILETRNLKWEIQVLSYQIEDLKKRIERIENKLFKDL
jgi:uncharacterized membrane protein YciS (DUF1049 family)